MTPLAPPQRFDRVAGRRRFFVSAMTLLGKQDGQGGSYLELAEFLTTRGSPAHRSGDLRQLWTRVAFNILVSNTDDHLRNHGFILEAGGWRLAPAYDQNPNVEKTAHTLAIDDRDQSADVGLALSTAHFYGLKPAEAQAILSKVTKVVAQWREQSASLRLPRVEIEQMAAAFRV